MPHADRLAAALHRHLPRIYDTPDVIAQAEDLLRSRLAPYLRQPLPKHALWDARDVVLITYADQLRTAGETPLQTLAAFLKAHGLTTLLRTVHLLPFFPYSSDDGFSVIDFRAVDPAVGTWADVAALRAEVELMFDWVLNHASAQSPWFQAAQRGEAPFVDYFIAQDPEADLSQVVRPRSSPLLTPYAFPEGTRHIWSTFSADQVDLNYANPAVLAEMLDVLLGYVARGARIVRLDAVGYLWKQPGTSCIHLPQTHAIIQLCRAILAELSPGTLLLTETNVPHAENVSYFGKGDEAHMVYQFSLPPLLLEACLSQDTGPLCAWLSQLEAPPDGCTYFNFTASHDGVGLRPLEGLVSETRLAHMVAAVRARGGKVSMRRKSDGSESPYELNITYVDALGPVPGDAPDDDAHIRRFLTSQALMLALQGIPGLYFHSLVGSPNDLDGARESGQPRRINRHKYHRPELEARLTDPRHKQARILSGMQRLLGLRQQQAAFHPDASQRVWPAQDRAQLAFTRQRSDGSERLLALFNLSDRPTLFQADRSHGKRGHDLLAEEALDLQAPIQLGPWQARWVRCPA